MIKNKIYIWTILTCLLLILPASAQLVSNVNIIIDGKNINFSESPAVNLTTGYSVPIEIIFSGEKDLNGYLRIFARINSNPEIGSNVYKTGPIQKGVNGYTGDLLLDLPNNTISGNYIMTINFNTKDEGQNVSFSIHIEGVDPLILNITEPFNNSILLKRNVNLTVNSNRDSNCSYNLRRTFLQGENDSYKNMSVTGLKNHTEIIRGLNDTNNQPYYLFVNCIDSMGIRGGDEIIFIVNLSKPVINLTSPQDKYKTTSNKVTFKYNANDDLAEVINCSLIINDEIKNSTSTVIENSENEFSDKLDYGIYNWKLSCINSNDIKSESELRELNIKKIRSISNDENLGESPKEQGTINQPIIISKNNLYKDEININTQNITTKTKTNTITNNNFLLIFIFFLVLLDIFLIIIIVYFTKK